VDNCYTARLDSISSKNDSLLFNSLDYNEWNLLNLSIKKSF